MARAVVVLPLPDSPTRASVCAARDGEADATHGRHAARRPAGDAVGDAAAASEGDVQVVDHQERCRGGRSTSWRGRRCDDAHPAVRPRATGEGTVPGAAWKSARRGVGQRLGAGAREPLLGARQEVSQHGHVAIGLLGVRHVTGLLEDDPLGLRDALGDERHLLRCGLVVAAAGEEDGHLDGAQARADVPAAQRAHDVELGRPVHGPIDLWIAPDLGERPRHRFRERHHAADVALVEDVDGGLVLGVVPGACGLVAVEDLDDLGRQVRAQASGLGDPEGHAGWRAGDGPGDDAGRLPHEVLHEQHAAPALAQDVHTLEAQRLAHGIDFTHVEVHRPACRIVRLVGIAAALLVIEDDASARGGHGGDGLDVVVAGTRSAVQQQQRHVTLIPLPLGVADDADPCAQALEGDEALLGAERRVDGHECGVVHVACSHVMCRLSIHQLGAPMTGRPAAGTGRQQGRDLRSTALHGDRAARRERAARGQCGRVGRRALDLGQAPAPLQDRRDAGAQPRGVRVVWRR